MLGKMVVVGGNVGNGERCISVFGCIIYQSMQGEQRIYEIRGQQFPFGRLQVAAGDLRKIFVKKRYFFGCEEEYEELIVKIDTLKNISHKNTINLRSIQERQGSLDMIYQYVPLSLEQSFTGDNKQTVKAMHRQFIELAIFLAKHCIQTTFSPSRCGILPNEQHNTLKYYLPLNEITITNNRNALERSVQLFNMQSMLYLDSLANQAHNSTINESCSQRTFKNRTKLNTGKERRDSQETGGKPANARKFSNMPIKEQMRKLSSLSRELSEITELHKKRGTSTRNTGGSFNTFRPVLPSKPNLSPVLSKAQLSESQQTLKRCVSQNAIHPQLQLNNLLARSRKALDSLHHLREKMSCYKGVINTLLQLHRQH